ncbi:MULTISPECIES: TetR/AcrR family transcriptional regulator [unclassified Mycobacterium]|uniref:TetR/AcrR family transcriptional regulator n=1 Tax=unclassified Mycobacterium TaxID=2642494 RepID=UPI0029C8A191|nr:MULTISPECIES: TetR/AcrR family transcriptional regulator [unclassified Mycobacterium]
MARPRAFDESAVIEAAQDRFWSFGYAATGLDDLVKATGLSKGSIYNTFGNKRALYLRTFERYCDGVVAQVAAHLDGPDETAVERLRALLEGVAGVSASTAVPRGCFLAKATAELAALDDDVQAVARRTFDQLENLLVGNVKAAQRAGAIDASRDPRKTGRHLLATLRGLEALASAGTERDVLMDAVDSLTESILD